MQSSPAVILKRLTVKTRAGIFFLELSHRGLFAVKFPKYYLGPRPGLSSGSRPGLDGVEILQQYFRNPKIPVKIKLDLTGYTAFEKRIYRTLCKVPPGKVISYSGLAKRAGFPGAARAVGSAMRKNRLPIVIPCHRVIHEDGTLGRYACGMRWKKFLLEHEGYLKN